MSTSSAATILLLQHLRDLYRNELDARLVIDWKDLSLIEKISDRHGAAGNAPSRVILKNS